MSTLKEMKDIDRALGRMWQTAHEIQQRGLNVGADINLNSITAMIDKQRYNIGRQIAMESRQGLCIQVPPNMTWEYCSDCENEVMIPSDRESRCPVCGASIVPCSVCDKMNNSCNSCPYQNERPVKPENRRRADTNHAPKSKGRSKHRNNGTGRELAVSDRSTPVGRYRQ